jgi:hypothetical protein
MKKYGVTDIDLIEIARAGAIGPISAGADLAEIGSLIWLPDNWQFDANGQFFVSWMNFGSVEVGFVATNNLVCVDYAKFYTAGFNDGLLEFAKVTRRKRIYIRNSFSHKQPYFTSVANEMKKNNINFSAEIRNYIPQETWGVMAFGNHLSFHFSCTRKQFSLEKSRLSFVSISNSSDSVFAKKVVL